MKVCIVSATVFKVPVVGYSGLEHLAWLQAKGLAERGHGVYLVAPDGSECPGVTVIPIGPAGRVDEARAYGGFPEITEGEGPNRRVLRQKHQGYWQHLPQVDVIVDHSWCKFSYQLKAEGRLKAPILGVMHAPVNTMYQTWPPAYPGLPPVEKPCAVCISQDQANHFEALFAPAKARVARNGIDLDFYKPLGIPRTDRHLFLARFSTIKGPDLAIEACRQVGVGLDLVGDTSITNEPEFLDRCKTLCDIAPGGVGPDLVFREVDGAKSRDCRIRMVGPASRGGTVWWFSQAHCMLHPNQRFREPLGLAPLESQACGTPVIAWRYGAMSETVCHGETGLLASSMEEFITHVRTMTEINGGTGPTQGERNRCREWASQFSVERFVKRYEELCQEAIEAPW